eukprot:gene13844-16323_t
MSTSLEDMLLRRTVAQLRAIVSEHEKATNQHYKVPTRKADITTTVSIPKKVFTVKPFDHDWDTMVRIKMSLTAEWIDELFKYYFETTQSLASFTLHNLPTNGTVKYCVECFMAGEHRALGHDYSIAYSTVSCLCDCGDSDAMASTSFCHQHRHADNDALKKQYIDDVPENLQEAFTNFFSKLIGHATSLASRKKYLANEAEIAVITTYMGKAVTRSPLYAQIIAQQVAGQTFNTATFQLDSPQRLALSPGLKRARATPTPSPLTQLFESHIDCASKSFYLFTVLSRHHRLFAQVFFRLYLSHYSFLMRPQAHIELAESCYHFQVLYQHPSSFIRPFTTGHSPNLILTLLDSMLTNMDSLHESYVLNREVELIHRYESMLLPVAVRYAPTAAFVAGDAATKTMLLRVAQRLHAFITPSFQFENVLRELKDLVQLEAAIINTFNHMLSLIPLASRLTESRALITETTARLIAINKQKPRVIGTRFIFPLPRILALALLHGGHEMRDQFINGTRVQDEADDYVDATHLCNELILNIVSFRVYFYAHCNQPRSSKFDEWHAVAPPTDDERHIRYFTPKTMMLDIYTLQVLLCRFGPRFFLDEVILDPFMDHAVEPCTDLFKSLLGLIVNVLQTRAYTTPTDQEVRYHYIQAVSTGYFFYSDLINFKQMFKTVSMERRKAILEEICVDTKALKMTLKAEYWRHYDPYYWHYEYSYRSGLLDRSRTHLATHQKANNIPESHPWLPAQLPPLDPLLTPIYNIFSQGYLLEILHHALLKMLIPEFKSFRGFSAPISHNHPVFSKLAPSSVVDMNDIFYLVAMALDHFEERERATAMPILGPLLDTFFDLKPAKRLTFDWGLAESFTLTHFLRVVSQQVRSVRKHPTSSLIDTLILCWNNNADDQNPLFSNATNNVNNNNNITNNDNDINNNNNNNNSDGEISDDKGQRKKMLLAKKEEIMRQMKEKQQLFLEKQANKQLYDQTDITEPPPAVATASRCAVDDADDRICMICQDRSNKQPLYAIAKITNFALSNNHRLASMRSLAKTLEPSHIKDGLAHLTNGKTMDDEATLMDYMTMPSKTMPNKTVRRHTALLAFIDSHFQEPTQISSCLHFTHSLCIQRAVNYFELGFTCPLCAAPSNIIIPLDASNLSVEELTRLHLALQSNDRHMWSVVYSNFELLECKSRTTRQYSPTGAPYHILSDTEFKNELTTLRMLYATVMSAPVVESPEDTKPLDPLLLFQIDPMLLASYALYLRRSDAESIIEFATKSYLFNYLLLFSLGDNLSYSQLVAAIKKLHASLDDTDQHLRDYMFPYLRKLLLLTQLRQGVAGQLTLQHFSDYDRVAKQLNIESIASLIDVKELDTLIKTATQLFLKKKNFSFYIPTSIQHLPKFRKLPVNYIGLVGKPFPELAGILSKYANPAGHEKTMEIQGQISDITVIMLSLVRNTARSFSVPRHICAEADFLLL